MGKTLFEKTFFILYAALFSIVLVIIFDLFVLILFSFIVSENLILIGISERYFLDTLKILSISSIIIFLAIMLLIFPDYLKDEDNKKVKANKEKKEVD